MANHERIDTNRKSLANYICSPAHAESAAKSACLLYSFSALRPYSTQYPDGHAQSVWYVSFSHKEEPYILNVNITPTYFQLEFRHPQFLPENIVRRLPTNQKWLYANSNKFSNAELETFLSEYLKNIRSSFDSNLIKYRKWHERKKRLA